MKIRNISCTQFAGVNNRSVTFDDGINVIYGKNESGKSTLVNLLSRTLFQNVRVDGRKDKEFKDLYFPVAKKGSAFSADFIDGNVSIETDEGSYVLKKEWGADPRCILTTPGGSVRDQATIDDILKDVLHYGEGVYSDILFSSQRNTSIALQTILDASNKTEAKQEIASAVTKAFAESDGISVDAIEAAINAKIDEIAGKHWNFEREQPEKKTTGRWANGLGEILKAYYALEDAKNVLKEISWMESEADRAAEDYAMKQEAVDASEVEYNKFNNFSNLLIVQSERRKAVTRLESELGKIKDVLGSWPILEDELKTARALQNEKEHRALIDKYEAAKRIYDELEAVDISLLDRPCPTDREILLVKNAQKTIGLLENKLCGMNLNAAIKMLGGNTVEIRSLRTGEVIELSGDTAQVSEAVAIVIPGVMEMQLSPADVDVSYVEAQKAAQQQVIDEIFEKYGVSSLLDIETLSRNIANCRIVSENANNRLSMLLGTTTFEELADSVSSFADPVRSMDEINREIMLVCRTGDVSKFVISKETIAAGYVTEYAGIPELKAKAYDMECELQKAKDSLMTADDIPAEYISVSDPEAYLDGLRRDCRFKQTLRDEAFKQKAAKASSLMTYRETLKGEPSEEFETAQRVFEEQKALLQHWLHISEVFKSKKEEIHDNPLQDIVDRFAENLDIISNGKVSSEFPEADKLNMEIYSGSRRLDFGKLSEGTKDTISLAFRIAVLDHLFPEGGGVIVLDDPFTDMDAERTEGACELLRNCAERHQVIFLTCKEEYLDMLNGYVINF